MASLALSLDADQQISAVEKDRPQNDRWRSEEIATRRGQPFTLLVVVDGEGQSAPGEAANLAVEIALAEARLRRDDPLPKLLAQLMGQMNEVVFRRSSGDMAGVTLAAIQGDTVWLAQAGSQTRCYRVRGGRSAALLTSDDDFPLGRLQSLPRSAINTYKLRRGDKLVFCSDGLYAGNLVSPTDIAKIDRYQDVKGAARHLSALAMGRNVSDNVTVLVAAYGRRSSLTFRLLVYILFAIAGATFLISLGALGLQRLFRPIPRPPDYGVAVLAEGRATQVEPLQILYPGSDVNASPDSPIHLSIKRRETLESAVTETIPNIDLYFGPGASFNLAAVDVEGFIDPVRGIDQPTNLAEISLSNGAALVLSQQPHTFYVWLGARGESDTPFAAVRGTASALGVERNDKRVELYCLRGSCSINIGRESILFPVETKTSLSLDDPGNRAFSFTQVSGADWAEWLSLCTTWTTDSEDTPEICQMLIP